jgi:WD40 repeat protein
MFAGYSETVSALDVVAGENPTTIFLAACSGRGIDIYNLTERTRLCSLAAPHGTPMFQQRISSFRLWRHADSSTLLCLVAFQGGSIRGFACEAPFETSHTVFEQCHAEGPHATALSLDVRRTADGQVTFLTGGADGRVCYFDYVAGIQLSTLVHSQQVDCVRFCSDTECLTATSGRVVRLWWLVDAQVLALYQPHGSNPITQLIPLSYGGQEYVMTAAWDRTCRLSALRDGAPVAVFQGHADWINGVDVSGDSTLAVSVSDDCSIRVWDLSLCFQQRRGKEIFDDNGPESETEFLDREIAACAFVSPSVVLSGAHNNKAHIWRLDETTPNDANPKILRRMDVTPTDCKTWIVSVAVGSSSVAGGSLCALSTDKGKIYILTALGGQIAHETPVATVSLDHRDFAQQVCFSVTAKHLFAATVQGHVKVYDTVNFEEVTR